MTRALLVACVLAGCSKGKAACPTADELARGSGITLSQRELGLVAGHCITDGWSAASIACVRAATDDESLDRCLNKLPPDQQQKLLAVLDPGGGADDSEKKREKHLAFLKTLAEPPFDQLLQSSPECADYRAAIVKASQTYVTCDRLDLLQQYGMQETVLGRLRDLPTRSIAQRPAECASAASELRASPELACN